jgi:hypothetical protein
MKLVCLMQHRRKCEAKIVMKVKVLKLKCVNSTMSGSQEFLWLIYNSSNNIMYCEVCIEVGPITTDKMNLLPKRNGLNMKVLFIE